MSGPNAEGPDTGPDMPPRVLRRRLPYDDNRCVRGDHWAGPEGSAVFLVEHEGLVCPTHITEDEMLRAAP